MILLPQRRLTSNVNRYSLNHSFTEIIQILATLITETAIENNHRQTISLIYYHCGGIMLLRLCVFTVG